MERQFNFATQTRNEISSLGFPSSDDYTLPTSHKTFADGESFGIEISSVNSFEIMERILEHSEVHKIRIDRFDECREIMRLPDNEIAKMVAVCAEQKIGLIMSCGPRAIYDTSAFAKSKNGSRIGYRLRGMDNIVKAVEDVKRAVDLGVRGILVYDEGLLDVLNKLRHKGVLPEDLILKVSVHCGHSNPVSCMLLNNLGADTINLVPDLDLPMIGAIRSSVPCPLDIFTDTALDAGGFIRTYDASEFIRIASPIYLKCGPISQKSQNHLPSDFELKERVKQTAMVVDHIRRYIPDAIQVCDTERTLAIPKTT